MILMQSTRVIVIIISKSLRFIFYHFLIMHQMEYKESRADQIRTAT